MQKPPRKRGLRCAPAADGLPMFFSAEGIEKRLKTSGLNVLLKARRAFTCADIDGALLIPQQRRLQVGNDGDAIVSEEAGWGGRILPACGWLA